MRRIRLVVVLGVVMAAMLALSAGPAMADDLDLGDVNLLGDDVVLLDEDVFDDDLDSSFFFGGFVSDCPFAGDFEGIVNQFDCFDDGDDFGDVVLRDDGDFCDDDDLFDDDGDFDDSDDGNEDDEAPTSGSPNSRAAAATATATATGTTPVGIIAVESRTQ